MKPYLKHLFNILAYTCITLGVVGIFLPLIPTTPFLLLAMILLTKSNPRIANWLINNRFLGVYIRSYLHGERLPLRDKIRMILLVWTVMLVSIIFATDNIYMQVGLIVIACAVTIHIVMLKPKSVK